MKIDNQQSPWGERNHFRQIKSVTCSLLTDSPENKICQAFVSSETHRSKMGLYHNIEVYIKYDVK